MEGSAGDRGRNGLRGQAGEETEGESDTKAKDNVAVNTIWTGRNDPLASDTGL